MSDVLQEFASAWGSAQAAPVTAKKEYAPLPDGKYTCQITSAQVDLTSQPNRVSITYDVCLPEEYTRRKIWANFTLTEKGIPILKSEMRKLGLDPDAVKKLDDLSEMLGTLFGKSVEIMAKGRKYMGKDGVERHTHNVYVQEKVDLKQKPPEPDFDETITF